MDTGPTVRPPGPRGLPGLGVAPSVARDPYRSFERIARTYGDVASVPLPGMPLVLVSHPDFVKHVMNSNHRNYVKPAMTRDVLFSKPPRFHAMTEGEEWRAVRRPLNPKFTERGLAPLSELMIDTIVETVDDWQGVADRGEAVDMQHEFTVLTMAVMLRSMFSLPIDRQTVEGLAHDFTLLLRGMGARMFTSSLPSWVPRPYARSFQGAMDAISSKLEAMVAQRRREPIDDDLLSMVLEIRMPDGEPLSEEHVRRELMGLVIGGYETTAAVLSWVLARLPSAPEAQARAYEEVDALGGERIRHEDLERLPWLRACFDEAQRLQGFPLNPREAVEDDEIGGYAIPKGTTVGVSGWALHRDPRFWRDPLRFVPSRFLDDEVDTYAFLPFGVGPRRCLGVRMGYMVGLYTLATAFQHFRFIPEPGWEPEPRFTFANVVKGGVPMTLERR